MIGNVKKVGGEILFVAIKHGNVHDIIALIHDNEVDVNCTNINGQTPLHVSPRSLLTKRAVLPEQIRYFLRVSCKLILGQSHTALLSS